MRNRLVMLSTIALLSSSADAVQAGPCTAEIDALAKTLATTDAGSGPTVGAAVPRPQTTTPETAQHPPTAAMGQETQGKATSPEDVRRQNQGKPPAAQQAERKAGTPDRMAEADNALQHARALDRQGKEAECMDSVRHAKELLGKR
jgi:hypothetical protein